MTESAFHNPAPGLVFTVKERRGNGGGRWLSVLCLLEQMTTVWLKATQWILSWSGGQRSNRVSLG